jgi:hypothetical protein
MAKNTPFINFAEFEQNLEEAERSLELLKERYFQVKEDQLKKQELEEYKIKLKREKDPKNYPLKTELNYIQEQIDQIEINLESRLFQWQEPFWLIVRFGGLGVVIGFILGITR